MIVSRSLFQSPLAISLLLTNLQKRSPSCFGKFTGKMQPSVNLILLLLLFYCKSQGALACTCAPVTIQGEYFKNDVFIRASVKNVIPLHGINRYRLKVETVFKGCHIPDEVWVTSSTDGGLCGVFLTLGISYVFSLPNVNPYQTITSCQVRFSFRPNHICYALLNNVENFTTFK